MDNSVIRGRYWGRAKGAVAPLSVLNTILYNTLMSCSPPLALRLRLNHETDDKKVSKH